MMKYLYTVSTVNVQLVGYQEKLTDQGYTVATPISVMGSK